MSAGHVMSKLGIRPDMEIFLGSSVFDLNIEGGLIIETLSFYFLSIMELSLDNYDLGFLKYVSIVLCIPPLLTSFRVYGINRYK